jgi:hypothetical protein
VATVKPQVSEVCVLIGIYIYIYIYVTKNIFANVSDISSMFRYTAIADKTAAVARHTKVSLFG